MCEDFFDFLGKVKDEEGHGLYVDLPFPGPGDKYKFRFTPEQHAVAAERLLEFREARVVCRFYECDEIHQLYKEGEDWDYIRLEGRKQTNETAPEILIVRK